MEATATRSLSATDGVHLARAAPGMGDQPSSILIAGVFVLAAIAALPGVFGGPALGDHEALVAQCARNMRLTGDWLVPRFMDIPWTRKPPLPYWLVAAVSYVFPNEPGTGLPVTPAAARFPSALAGLGTILLLWKLASAMFGRRVGVVTAVIASSTILFLQYSPNATAEMPLTFCCVWAYMHFWYAVTIRDDQQRSLHLQLFYVALGVGMMVKGPAPVAMVGLPLAVWWYSHRPLRHIARRGPSAWRAALVSFACGFWPRTAQAFTKLWLIPGLGLFAWLFVPWMLAAASRAPEAVDEWKWQYVMRAQGDYLDSRDRRVWYYLPYIVGLTAPWVFLLVEAAAAPWLKRYARLHRPLLFAGLWALVAVLVMSLEPFKKPYYILPAIPGLLLLMGVVAERFYSLVITPKRMFWLAWALAVGGLWIGAVYGLLYLRENYPGVSGRLSVVVAALALLIPAAAAAHILGRAWISMAMIAITTIGAFQVVWHTAGSALDNVDRAAALAEGLDQAGVPADAHVLWADGRPDARVEFYFGRKTGYMIRPGEIVSEIQNRKQDKSDLEMMALARAQRLLKGAEPVYLILERDSYEYGGRVGNLSAEVIVEVGRGGTGKKDWLVVTNRARPGAALPGGSRAAPE